MPFVSSNLDYAREQADGSFKCRETHIDHDGQAWIYVYAIDSLASAQTARDGREVKVAQRRRSAEVFRAANHINNGGTWANYVLQDIATLDECKTRVVRQFRRHAGPIAETMAAGVAALTLNKIKNLIIVDDATAQQILDRAANIASHVVDRAGFEADTVGIE